MNHAWSAIVQFATTLASIVCLAMGTLSALGQTAAPAKLRGSISGTLLDEVGRPLEGWAVVVARWNYHFGQKTLYRDPLESKTAGNGTFELAEVPEGEYLLRAESPALVDWIYPVKPPTTRTPQQPTLVYYPGVMDAESSTVLRVEPGRPIRGITFRIRPERAYAVRGQFFGVPNTQMWLRTPGQEGASAVGIRPGADGRFELGGLSPGSYVIECEGMKEACYAPVTIRDADVEVRVDTRPCPRVRGRLTFDGQPVPEKFRREARVTLNSYEEAMGLGAGPFEDGSIQVACLAPGLYLASVFEPEWFYIRSVTLDGRPSASGALDMTGSNDKTLDIDLASGAGTIFGTVGGAKAVGVTVWDPLSGVNETQTAVDGKFRFEHLPPGSYRVAGWDQLYPQNGHRGVTSVAEFRDAFTASAALVTLARGEEVAVAASLMERSEIEAVGARLGLHPWMTPRAEELSAEEAVKSPESFVKFLEENEKIDWTMLGRALGFPIDYGPCGGTVPGDEGRCQVKLESVQNPPQAVVAVSVEGTQWSSNLFRFLRDASGAWRPAGLVEVSEKEERSTHSIERYWNKPFLRVSETFNQNGISTGQRIENWYDLTREGFDPVFTFSSGGYQYRWAFGVARSI